MTKLLFAALVCAGAPLAATAAPLWDQADRWACELDLYFKVQTDGAGYTTLDAETRTIIFDFKEGTQSSVFVDTPGKIIEKRYFAGDYGNFNSLAVDWGPGIKMVNLIEEGGQVWMPAVSNLADGEPWFANYRCEAEG